MITIFRLSQTRAEAPNSLLKTPIVPGPQTSWVIRISAFTQTLSPASTLALPAARAKIFSVKVIETVRVTEPAAYRNLLSNTTEALQEHAGKSTEGNEGNEGKQTRPPCHRSAILEQCPPPL